MSVPVPKFDERLQLLIDTVSDALVFATPDGQVIGCNRNACAMFGYSQEEMVRLRRRDLTIDDERLAAFRREREQTGSSRGAVTFVRKGGQRFEGEVTSIAVTADGQAQTWIVIRDLADRRRAEAADAALRESNEMLRALTDAAFEAVVIHRDGVILIANRAAELAARVEPGGLAGKNVFDFIAPESIPMVMARIKEGNEQPYESRGRRSDGSTYPQEIQVRVGAISVNGAPARVAAIRDVSERRKLEEQVRQAQKMDAIGQLAGGIAHDFNNLLSVILGAASLAATELGPDHPSQANLDDVCRAAERAAELTHKLLAFSRKQVLKAQVIDVNRVLAGMESMIRRLLAANVAVEFSLADDVGHITADPGQLELMMLNLVANARDAMPEGGKLVVSTRNLLHREAMAAGLLDVAPVPHVIITVSDSGTGIAAETKEHIFEPFFTTKGIGHGTGLGLSTVFGIVKQSGGSITFASEPGRGTTFTIGFPRASGVAVTEPPRRLPEPAPPIGKTVLIAEDNAIVRRVVTSSLERAGYRVLDAAGPVEALELARARSAPIDLLLTDVVMPHLGGTELAEQVTACHPETRVLFMSGYADDAINSSGVFEGSGHFLAKPFTPEALVAMVRTVLE